ncbi:MAG TPA: ThuA domain-containing protein [Acidimicrobiales bacterium]|nr:ThuA domain-containing protein [Acidimicrobiales bacterium]
MRRAVLYAVTQVAPYGDGPAGVHGVLGQAATALTQLARRRGLEPVVVEDVADLPAVVLEHGGVLALFTIGETPWDESQRQAISSSVRAGRLGLLGVHSATDACYGWPDYGVLLGARFDGHPWTERVALTVDTGHPATAHLPARWTWRDEIYLFRDLRPDARVLVSVAEGQLDMTVPGARRPGHGFPLAWCFAEGAGRVFYSALGHFPDAWEQPAYLRHLDGALGWLLEHEVDDPGGSLPVG